MTAIYQQYSELQGDPTASTDASCLERSAEAQSGFAYVLILLLLSVSSMLLPIDIGFPIMHIAGLPLRLPTIIACAALFVFALAQPSRLGETLASRVMYPQYLFLGFLLLGALLSHQTDWSLATIVAYATVYVIEFAVAIMLLQLGYGQALVYCIALCAAVAAAVGIAEGLSGTRLPFYTSFYSRAEFYVGEIDNLSFFRVHGTLGNPIVYCTMLMMSLPFAASIPHRLCRWVLCAMILLAAALTVSRTIVLLAAPLLIGFLVTRRRARLLLLTVLLALITAHFVVPSATMMESVVSDRWLTRTRGIGNDSNVQYRLDGLKLALAHETSLAGILLGSGLKAETELGKHLPVNLKTVDNTYASVYIDLGLLGLVAYMNAFPGFLWRVRSLARTHMAFYGLLGLMLSGASFVTYWHCTFNFLTVALMAVLYVDSRGPSRSPMLAQTPRMSSAEGSA